MKRDQGWATVELMGLGLAMLVIAFVVGYATGAQSIRDEAVRHGSALESVDIESGAMRFEWK